MIEIVSGIAWSTVMSKSRFQREFAGEVKVYCFEVLETIGLVKSYVRDGDKYYRPTAAMSQLFGERAAEILSRR
jgi:hypothetical protein